MLTNADKFLSVWEPRIGNEAARLRWRGSVLLLRGYALNFIWIPCVIAGAKIPSTALVVVGVIAGCTEAGHLVLGSLKLRAANKVAGRLLGIKLGFRHVNPPPRSRERYEEWCRRRGVTPYAAGPADAGVHTAGS